MLAGAGGAALAGTAGCLDGLRAGVERDAPEQISVTIKTFPADENRICIQIARHLAQNMERAGMSVDIQPTTADQLFRDILVNRDYEMYVAQHPGHFDPDYLYAFLHSRFIEEPGWQNPLGYANVALVDHQLEEQRRLAGDDRQAVLDELQRAIAETVPFATVAFPDKARATAEERFTGWGGYSLGDPLGYITIEPRSDQMSEPTTVHVGTVDTRITRNLNPFSVEFRSRGVLVDLLYDSLGRVIDGSIVPWLAESWSWDQSGPRTQSLFVRLRDDLRWHDGTELTASDAVFTYRFIRDSTMQPEDPIVPVPRFRGRSTLYDSVWRVDDRTVEIRFDDEISREVALSMLTVPVIPENEWADKSELTEIIGFDLDNVTEALIWDNLEPVGSGPLQIETVETDEQLVLERFPNHFLQGSIDGGPLSAFEGQPRYDRIAFDLYPSESAIVEMIAAGELDATADGLSNDGMVRAGRASGVSLRINPSTAHYHVGFNNRVNPLNNPRFRKSVSRLIDREYVVTEIFNRYAMPSFSPIKVGGRVPSDLEWEPEHELGYIGGNGDGLVHEERARDLFRDAGYLYRDDRLLQQ